MKTEPGERSLTPISGVVLLLVGLGGTLFLERPFQSLRPENTESFQRLKGNLEDVEARLWEDPLQAVHRRQQGTPDTDPQQPEQRLEVLSAQVRGSLTGEGAGRTRLQLLGVMVPGGPYPEDVERRRRRRMAVLSGLALAGYVPRQSEWLGYFFFATETSPQLAVPYEWLEPEGLRSGADPELSQVLVLWLDEEGLGARPLERAAEVFVGLMGGDSREDQVQLALLGPASSGTLHSMLLEKSPDTSRDPQVTRVLERLSVHSPWATAGEELLLKEADCREEETLEDALKASFGIQRFSSTVARDDEMAEELLRELGRRGVDLATPGESSEARLVLISEWDTFYGRALPAAFVRALENRVEDRCPEDTPRGSSAGSAPEHEKRILRYTYLRGLDGRGPRAKSGEASRMPTSAEVQRDPSEWSSEKKRLERAVGPGQLDGIRRLVEQLQRQEEEGTAGKIRAIGILGSDLYDKQLLLQALRPRFPRAVFFTTDLDARLLHPASYRWSRNLVVASTHGLDPMEAMESGDSEHLLRTVRIAPFRDAYQVSTFLATRQALGLTAITPKPRLFEIGRKGPVELRLTDPQISPAAVFGLLGFGVGGIVLLTLAPVRSGRRWLLARPVFRRHPEWLPQMAVLTMGALAFALVGWVCTRSWEPLLFSQGVSIWPTELLRVLALVLCWLLLLRAHRELTDNAKRLQEEMGLPEDPEPPLPLIARWKRWWHRWQGLRRAQVGGHLSRPSRWGENLSFFIRVYRWVWPSRWQHGGEEVPVSRCWRRYRRLSDWRYRLERIAPLVFGYLLFGVLLSRRLGAPFVPARGSEALWADKLVLIVSVISMVFLTFFVLDETLMCRTLIRHLRSGPSRWPSKARKDFAGHYRLPESDVATLVDTRFIADLTAVSGRLVIYPFIVFTLMMVARHRIFDGWDWPLGLLLILGLMVSLVAACALILRREAEKARQGALGRLRKGLFEALNEDDDKTRDVREKQLRLAIEEVSHQRRGAFGHWSQHPVLRAVLIPFGGLGMLSLLEVLSFLGL